MKKAKKKHRLKSFLVIFLFLYLIIMLGYYLFKTPIKNIYIYGNKYVSDLEIIETAGIKNYPSFLHVKTKSIKKKLEKNPFITKASIKKTILGKVTIKIDEAHPLFISKSDNLIYLSNEKTVANSDKYLGLPLLINYVPKNILKDFIDAFKNIDENIVAMINEIEYQREEKDDVVIDETRFLLRMNDTNTVYVNTINLKKLNQYAKICATTNGVKGIIYLNSNRDTISITSYDSIKNESKDKSEN